MTSAEKLYFYPVWLRIWHGLNAIGILTLIFTGLSMQSSIESSHILAFNTIVKLHNIAGILVTLSYMLYFFGNLFTLNGKFYIVKPSGFLKRPIKQAIWFNNVK